MSAQNVVEVPRRMLASINPVTGELMREYEQHSDEVIENKLQLASKTFREYRNVPFAKRAQMMICAAEILEKGKANFGRLMTQEMGKLLRAAIPEVEKCAFGCRYFADNGERFLADEEAKLSFVDASRSASARSAHASLASWLLTQRIMSVGSPEMTMLLNDRWQLPA